MPTGFPLSSTTGAALNPRSRKRLVSASTLRDCSTHTTFRVMTSATRTLETHLAIAYTPWLYWSLWTSVGRWAGRHTTQFSPGSDDFRLVDERQYATPERVYQRAVRAPGLANAQRPVRRIREKLLPLAQRNFAPVFVRVLRRTP